MSEKFGRRYFLKSLVAATGLAVSSCLAQPGQNKAAARVAEEDDTVYLPVVTTATQPVTGTLLTNILFVHHSVGAHLMKEGNARGHLYKINSAYRFWDHDYNGSGFFGPDGQPMPYNYNIPNDYTNPPDYAAIFSQPYNPNPSKGAPANAFSGMMRHEVILFKSCYGVSKITDDQMLESYKVNYRTIRDRIDQFPEKLFIVMSPPPLRACEKDYTATVARRARAFANWLKSPEYLDGHPNMAAIDLFNEFAWPDDNSSKANKLRPEYEYDPFAGACDGHPNTLASQTVGPVFAQAIDQAIRKFAAS